MNQRLIKKLANYSVPKNAVQLIRDTDVVFMVGITGAGKDSVRHRLLETGNYHHIVSHTTRAKRKNHGIWETDGVEYHFVDLETVETMIDNSGFVEAKLYSGNVYGTSVAEIQMAHDEGKIAISDVEVQGVAEYRAVADNVIPIFLLPPNFDIWQSRIAKRYGQEGNHPEDIKKRMQAAKVELKEALDKDYFEFLVNNDLEYTIKLADEIAHGKFSAKKNEEARSIAKQLLADIEKEGY